MPILPRRPYPPVHTARGAQAGLLPPGFPALTRRQFVLGTAAGAALVCSGLGRPLAAAVPTQALSGRAFDLTIDRTPVNYTGKDRLAVTVNGTLPAPILRWREGDDVTLRVHNRLDEDTSIHWHGLILPSAMDGVPGISEGFHGIHPGETFTYRFPVRQSGTYWYHGHSGFQEQLGLYGAIIIDPAEPRGLTEDREHVIVLSDWSDEEPVDIFRTLKKNAEHYNFNQRTVSDLAAEMKDQGLAGAFRDRAMWNAMRMSDRDISDVTGATYTFLMNGVTPAEGFTALFAPGEAVRLRIINAAAMTFFDFRIPGLEMRVVGADGQDIEPVTVEELRLGVAETYDVVVRPAADRAYALFAQAIDRSGFARGTLTPHPDLQATPPELDPRPFLSHADMGMGGHGGHDMGGHSGHDMGGHSGHAMGGQSGHGTPSGLDPAGLGSEAPVVHADSERGPGIDMRAEAPTQRLDDPGVGLRDNGRRVLTYADLFHRHATPDPREPDREIQLHLTGNMHRYMWSMDGIRFADAEPLVLHHGERLRITLVNDTMMNHPIHLHGMWSDLETGDPDRIPRKHTVIVQPGAKLSYLVTADAPGPWAYHCHLLYHMMGMFREVVVT